MYSIIAGRQKQLSVGGGTRKAAEGRLNPAVGGGSERLELKGHDPLERGKLKKSRGEHICGRKEMHEKKSLKR